MFSQHRAVRMVTACMCTRIELNLLSHGNDTWLTNGIERCRENDTVRFLERRAWVLAMITGQLSYKLLAIAQAKGALMEKFRPL